MWGFGISLLGAAIAVGSYFYGRSTPAKSGGTAPTPVTDIPPGVVVPAGTTLTMADVQLLKDAVARGAPMSDINDTLGLYYIYQSDFTRFVSVLTNAGVLRAKDPAQTPVGDTPHGLTLTQFASYYH